MSELGLLLIPNQIIVIFSSGESCQAIFINVESEGINTGNGNVNSQIEFEAIEKEWIIDVLTDDMRGAFLGDL